MSGAGLSLLLVEDSPADARLVQEALAELRLQTELHVAHDGAHALDLLAPPDDAAALVPDLILLDLNLPRVHGLVVLDRIKADARLRHIPVVVLTTSAAESDVRAAYDRHANSYVVKPVDFVEFVGAIRTIEAFWLDLARRPEHRPPLG